ncbi:hypothetical protein SFK1770_2437 [Shigella flexneri K-1770]|nr:hypothetical protein SFK1770_2437 [Shigella flexneri K-1770]
MYTEKHIRIISVTTARPSIQSSVRLRMTCNCARDPRRQRLTKLTPHPRAIRARALSTFCPSIFNGFFEEFIFHRFLPSRRWSSLICFMAAASSEAGTTCSPAATAVRLPSWYCLRQRNNWLAATPCCRFSYAVSMRQTLRS